MNNKIKITKLDLLFTLFNIINIYVYPCFLIISSKLNNYDLSDTIMGIIFFTIPLGLLVIAFIYGIVLKKLLLYMKMIIILLIPALVFICIIDVSFEYFIIYGIYCIITFIGISFGIIMRYIASYPFKLKKHKTKER